MNFIRLIHYPPDPRVTRCADELGLLVSEEIPAYAAFPEPAVVETATAMVQAMIERDFNRPSVIIWFIGSGAPVYGTDYLNNTIGMARRIDPGRLVTFMYDDNSFTVEQIQSNAATVRNAGATVFAQNAYWPLFALQQAASALPTDMPALFTEWTGAEGSQLGPIGGPGAWNFPENHEDWGGYYPETYEAIKMVESFNYIVPYTNCANAALCISGMVYFNWQDTAWPGYFFVNPEHYGIVRNGLVYEDRTTKSWPVAIFNYLMAILPHDTAAAATRHTSTGQRFPASRKKGRLSGRR